jgi:hypothetical protein
MRLNGFEIRLKVRSKNGDIGVVLMTPMIDNASACIRRARLKNHSNGLDRHHDRIYRICVKHGV